MYLLSIFKINQIYLLSFELDYLLKSKRLRELTLDDYDSGSGILQDKFYAQVVMEFFSGQSELSPCLNGQTL